MRLNRLLCIVQVAGDLLVGLQASYNDQRVSVNLALVSL